MACRHIPVSEPNSVKIVYIHFSEPYGVQIVPPKLKLMRESFQSKKVY